ncbi:hypothetical protein KTH_30840 [Thermosporothrix hazakensis]|nr:hypothetical protein KTH_30840 [Thermosporothrix hazakensis]
MSMQAQVDGTRVSLRHGLLSSDLFYHKPPSPEKQGSGMRVASNKKTTYKNDNNSLGERHQA